MAICKRSSKDPLLRTFLDRYNLNLLSIPREKSDLGSLYVRTNGRISTPGSITHFLTPKFKIPVSQYDEKMADVYGKITNAVSFSIGIGFLDGFFTAIGSQLLLNEIKVSYEQKQVHSFKFSFKDALRDSIDVGLMGSKLIRHQFNEQHALINPGNRYFLVTGVAKSSSITVISETKDYNLVNLGAEIIHTVNANGNIEISIDGEGAITYTGKEKLIFGVELYELKYDEKRKKMKMLMPPEAIQIRSAKNVDKPLLEPVFLNEDEDAFIDVDEFK